MDNKLIKVQASLVKPNELIEFASVLKKVIVEQNLYTNIKGKNYPHVEAWQFTGGAIGVLPIVESLEDLSDESMIKYKAVVKLKRLETNEVVGRGIAVCTNKEQGKQHFDEYAIASMAQTRAIGKAYRTVFGWLMKLAGYEATPIEEVDFATSVKADNKEDIIKANKNVG